MQLDTLKLLLLTIVGVSTFIAVFVTLHLQSCLFIDSVGEESRKVRHVIKKAIEEAVINEPKEGVESEGKEIDPKDDESPPSNDVPTSSENDGSLVPPPKENETSPVPNPPSSTEQESQIIKESTENPIENLKATLNEALQELRIILENESYEKYFHSSDWFKIAPAESEYTLQSEIGKGFLCFNFYRSYAEVFSCHKKDQPTPELAIKRTFWNYFTPNPDDIDEDLLKQVFVTEARILQLLKHPNIIAVEDAFVFKTPHSLVMDMIMPLVSGRDLSKLMDGLQADEKTVAMRESDIAYVIYELLKIVEYLHENLVVHRDIKSGNVLIQADGKVVLCDFGMATIVEHLDDLISGVVGTLLYMAPEIKVLDFDGSFVQSVQYNYKVDIWSVCMVLFDMVEPVYEADRYEELSLAPIPIPINYRILSDDCRNFLTFCLRIEPHSRPTASMLLKHEFLKKRSTPAEFAEHMFPNK